MIKIILTLTYLIYLFFGFFTLYFNMRNLNGRTNNNIVIKFMWWHGFIFIIMFVAVIVLSISLVGAQMILSILQ